jgi:hypothetical protein
VRVLGPANATNKHTKNICKFYYLCHFIEIAKVLTES